VVRESNIKNTIEDIVNLRKPRSLSSLLKMVYSVVKYYSLSKSNLYYLVLALVLYRFLLKHNQLLQALFYLLDKLSHDNWH